MRSFTAAVATSSARDTRRVLSTRINIAAPSFFKSPTAQAETPLVFTARPQGLPPPKEPVQVRSRYGLPGAKTILTNSKLPETLVRKVKSFYVVAIKLC